jgi:hypothetical protein
MPITPTRLQKLGRAAGVVFTEQAGLALNDAIREFKKTFDDSEAWSSKAVKATERFARFGSLNSLKNLTTYTPAFVLVVYEAELLRSSVHKIDAEARAAEIKRLINPLPKGAALPHAARDLVAGAKRRLDDLRGIERRKKRPANSHVDLLVVRVARIVEEAGGSARIGRDEPTGNRRDVGSFADFLYELHEDLPRSPRSIRPATPRAFVRHAKNSLPSFHKVHSKSRPPRTSWMPGEDLDRAISAALKPARGKSHPTPKIGD